MLHIAHFQSVSHLIQTDPSTYGRKAWSCFVFRTHCLTKQFRSRPICKQRSKKKWPGCRILCDLIWWVVGSDKKNMENHWKLHLGPRNAESPTEFWGSFLCPWIIPGPQALLFLFLLLFLLRLAWRARELLLRRAEEVDPAAWWKPILGRRCYNAPPWGIKNPEISVGKCGERFFGG